MRCLTIRQIAAVTVTVLGIAACTDNSTPDSTSPNNDERLSVVLSVVTDTIPESLSKAITARVTDQAGVLKLVPVTWKSSDASVASVSAGTVTGVSAGTAMIIASVGSGADSATIIVTPKEYTLDVQPSAAAVAVGDTINFRATLRSNTGDHITLNNLTWTSSDTLAARFVSGSSLVGKSEGEVLIAAETVNGRGEGSVKVFRTPVSSVTISPSTANVTKGQQLQLTVTLRDQQGRLTVDNVTFGSSDYGKATVNQDGIVKGLATGTVVITATSGRKTGSATINVLGTPASSVSLVVPSDTVPVGVELQATATPLDASGNPLTDRTIAYQSANPAVVTINSSGVVKGITEGSTTISAIVDAKIATKRISVGGRQAASLVISPQSPSVSLGKQSQLTAKVLDQMGLEMSGQAVSWSSANSAVAQVSSSGLVTAISAGSTSISATSSGLSASVTLAVVSAPVASVQVSPANVSLTVGGSVTLNATAFDADGNLLTGRSASWSSQNPTVASVNSTGGVSAVGAGSTSVTATIEGKSSSVTVNVGSAPAAPVSSVTVTVDNPALSVGQQTQAVAILKDAQGNVLTRAVTWSSLDEAVAKVNSSGLITAYAGGTVAIIAQSEGVSGSASLTVNTPSPAAVAQVLLEVPTRDLVTGQSIQSVVTLKDAQGNILLGRTITYSTENSSIVTVSATGVIKGISAGSARVSASSGGVSGNETFQVTAGTQPLASITINPASATLSIGQTSQATAVGKDAQGSTIGGTSFTWTTSNPAAATVSSSGVVSAVGVGAATIRAAASGVTGSMAVTVVAPTVAAVTVTLNPSIQVGGTAQASAVARDAAGNALSGKTFVWTSGTSSIAAVSSSGLVTGLTAGSSQIRATTDGVIGSSTVTVSSAVTSVAPPELPRVTPPSQDPYPGRPCSVTVAAGGNVGAALSAARGGTVVCLTAGTTYGQVRLPARAAGDTGWIVVRTATTLPPEGTRVRPSTATGFATISVANADPPITTAPGTFGWFIAGLRITTTGSLTYRLVELGLSGAEQDQLSEVPRRIVLSRVLIDGANAQIQRCISLNSGETAIVDSWLMNCHIKGFEGQGIGSWNGPGPYLIRNNYIEAAGINILFGGATPSLPNMRTMDVTIQRNHVFKPLAWKGVWTVKNLLETKNAGRILVEENIFENSWLDAQTGLGILFKSSNDQGTCNWCQTTDVTYRRNMLRNVETGMSVTAGENYCRNAGAVVGPDKWCQVRGEIPPPTSRVLILENVFDDLGNTTWGAKGIYLAPVHSPLGVQGLIVERNVTAQGVGKLIAHGIAVDSPGAPNGVFRNNVFTNGAYPIVSDGIGFGLTALNAGAPGYQWSNNWFVKLPNHTGGSFTMPTGTTIVTSEAAAVLAAEIRATVTAATTGVAVPP